MAKKKVGQKRKTTKKTAKKTKKKATSKKVPQKKATRKKATQKKALKTKPKSKNLLFDSLLELIKVTSTVVPDDVSNALIAGLEKEQKDTTAEYAMKIIQNNIDLAKKKVQPLCQDTGTIIFSVGIPVGYKEADFRKTCEKAVVKATRLGYLRQNSVDPMTGKNEGMNIGPGHPSIKF